MLRTSVSGPGASRDPDGRAARPSRRALLRATAGASAAALLTGALTGCARPASASRPVTVRIWSWLTGMDRYVAAFNESQSDVRVELSVIAAGLSGGYAQQTNAIRAHNAPDILHVEYQGLPQILLTGGLRDLTDDLADLADGYSPAAWRAVRPDGRTWGIPMDLAPMALYYRKDLFDRHGIAVPATWEEFRGAAEAVREVDRAARITTFPLNDGSFFAGMSWQAGDPWWRIHDGAWHVGVSGEGTLRTAQYWQEMIAGDLVRSGGTGTQDWIAGMHEGRLWGLLGASWSVGTLNKSIPEDTGRWAVTTMPTWDGVPANGMQGGTAFGISAESEVPEAALTFLRWLSTDPAVPRIGSTFTSPFPAYLSNREVARESYRGGYFLGDPVYDVLDEAATRVPEWTWGPNALGLFSTVVDAFGGVPTGDTTLPDAVRRVQSAAVATMRERGLAVVEGNAA
ncbi:ABC transporter substrate-binding protein [Allostreptomyces psammosilenae]|uniref:Multiple sugar transport system substrate-binding protein n=1 Tax=Allostreptomyces psammosilenae TaxID=1892865 RepID=A0A852ZY70_9ACTN|nr:sugar ABC transporter substrate-binding protein [Allostreptomyces psammosilenae]NYI07323.1 multiple sugar transport system substrate-binding protein [Allostreptomyces psammosilenae]